MKITSANVSPALPAEIESSVSELSRAYDDEWAVNYLNTQRHRCHDDVVRVSQLANGGRVLNIGGAPYLFEHLYSKTPRSDVVSADLDPSRHEAVTTRFGIPVVRLNIEDADDRRRFDFSPFDVVCICEVFEHLRIDLIRTFQCIRDGMRRGAHLYLTTPNFYYAPVFARTLLQGRSGPPLIHEWQKLVDLGHMGHVREYSRREMIEFLTHVGFAVKSVLMRNSRAIRHSGNPLYLHRYLVRQVTRIPALSQEIVIVAERR